MRRARHPASNPDEVRKAALAISQKYRDSLPPDYRSRFSNIADEDKLDIIFRGTRAGLRMPQVCEAAGIDYRTIQRWTQLAEQDPESPHGVFVTTLKLLRRQGQVQRLEKIEAHGDREWTPLAWLNERTDQETYALQKDKTDGPAVIVQIGVKDSDVQVQISADLSPSTQALPVSLSTLALEQGEAPNS
jgi:hypothetical protein